MLSCWVWVTPLPLYSLLHHSALVLVWDTKDPNIYVRGGGKPRQHLQKWDGGTEVSDNLPKRCQHFQLPDRSVCLCQSKQEDGSAIWTEFKAKQRTKYPFSDQVSCSSLQMSISNIPCKSLWEQKSMHSVTEKPCWSTRNWELDKSSVEKKPLNSRDTRHTSKLVCIFSLLESTLSHLRQFHGTGLWILLNFE